MKKNKETKRKRKIKLDESQQQQQKKNNEKQWKKKILLLYCPGYRSPMREN